MLDCIRGGQYRPQISWTPSFEPLSKASFALTKTFLDAILFSVLPWISYACVFKSDFCFFSYSTVLIILSFLPVYLHLKNINIALTSHAHSSLFYNPVPWQRTPFPSYPDLHLHLYDPGVLVHTALAWQPCWNVEHSLISLNQSTNAQAQKKRVS